MSNTFVNFPPAPSDPVTPLDIPSRSGTPNSTTTSMSELSTVAIKDGHRGHLPHHHAQFQSSGLSNQLDAERADRISRLAGLERVTTARIPQTPTNLTPGASAPPQSSNVHGYFDQSGNPAIMRERSTVGSASATGSVGQNTTWAGSEAGDASNFDKMSESQDMEMEDARSVGGASEEGAASLVAFGEGARTPARQSILSSTGSSGTPYTGAGGQTPRDARYIDGMTYDPDVVDTTSDSAATRARLTGSGNLSGVEQAERTVRENMDTTSADRMRRGQFEK